MQGKGHPRNLNRLKNHITSLLTILNRYPRMSTGMSLDPALSAVCPSCPAPNTVANIDTPVKLVKKLRTWETSPDKSEPAPNTGASYA